MAANKKLGILTGGGDVPGLNPAIKAVVETAIDRGWEVLGIKKGYEGLLDELRIYSRALSIDEIKAIYRGRSNRPLAK